MTRGFGTRGHVSVKNPGVMILKRHISTLLVSAFVLTNAVADCISYLAEQHGNYEDEQSC